MAKTKSDKGGDGWGIMDWAALKRPSDGLARAAYVVLILFALFTAGIGLVLFFRILGAVFNFENGIPIEKADDLNKVMLGLGGLIGATTGVPFLIWRTLISQRQNTIAQANLDTTTMARAIEQLGATREVKTRSEDASETLTESKPNLEVRLGALYLLEQLAQTHQGLHWPIMEILCAYVRENAGPPDETRTDPPRVDVQAAITVIGRRSTKQIAWEAERRKVAMDQDMYRLDLSYCQLRGARFDGLNFNLARFSDSRLTAATLKKAQLKGSNFENSFLERANFSRAHLEGADMMEADLPDAILHSAHLQWTDFSSSDLTGSWLWDADFENARVEGTIFAEAKGLSSEMAAAAWGNTETKLPFLVIHPKNERWDESEDIDFENFNIWKSGRDFWRTTNWTPSL
jgi:hypothetical protein